MCRGNFSWKWCCWSWQCLSPTFATRFWGPIRNFKGLMITRLFHYPQDTVRRLRAAKTLSLTFSLHVPGSPHSLNGLDWLFRPLYWLVTENDQGLLHAPFSFGLGMYQEQKLVCPYIFTSKIQERKNRWEIQNPVILPSLFPLPQGRKTFERELRRLLVVKMDTTSEFRLKLLSNR